MRTFFLLAVLLFAHALAPLPLVREDYASIKSRAEELYARGSYEKARLAYAAVDLDGLEPAERRFVEFRLADTGWRAIAASESADDTEIQKAHASLEALQKKIDRPEARDRLWATVEESLGDFFWTRRNSRDFGSAEPHYRNALDWWAGARGRERRAGVISRSSGRWLGPTRSSSSNGRWLGHVPLDVAENALRVASDARDRAEVQFLFAMVVRNRGGDADAQQRGLEALEAAITAGKSTPWYDDALFACAQWYESNGVPVVQEDGSTLQKQDYVKALAVYRRITEEFRKGDTPYFDQARAAIERIVAPEMSLSVPSAFLPGSEIGYGLQWRNVPKIDLALYTVDLARDVHFRNAGGANASDRNSSEWLRTIDLHELEKRAAWTYATHDEGDHVPGSIELRYERKLAPGAYILEARAGAASAREIVLVSASSLVVKAAKDKALVWFCDALTSRPIGGARVRVWEHVYDKAWHWRSIDLTTGDDGVAVATLSAHHNQEELFVAAVQDERTAFSLGASAQESNDRGPWKIYAFTDRSTYRPLDGVQWKITARTSKDGAYTTPAGEKLAYEITDPRGAKVEAGELALNAFGSAWAALDTTAAMPLGPYQVNFFTVRKKDRTSVGNATLFRLEEYKLPEFEVKVSTPEKDGKKRLYRAGDKVEATIDAQYYFGGPVESADVEAIVYQRPYWHRPIPLQHEFGWLYGERENAQRFDNWGGQGQIVTRTTIKTDAAGHASVVFDTPRNTGQDFEYTIEARVTDASRREITNRSVLRVTREAYAVDARVAHNLYRPGDKAEFTFEAKDANDNPVEAEGHVTLVRNRWIEVWIDPTGREVRGGELEHLRSTLTPFPPAPAAGERAWSLKSSGYETVELASTTVKTNAKGIALYDVVLTAEGYYSATWKSRDDRGGAIATSVSAWCASGDTRTLGYHAGGLAIVVDKDTFKAGETAPVMLCTPVSDRWVLFSVESEVLHSWQVVHVEGTVKLITLPIGAEHVPNVFLSAFTANEGDALAATEEVVVPPFDRFLDVEVKADRAEVQPGEEGWLDITTRDRNGEPVSAEVALALVDESVAAIQSEYAIDPRQFFYGEKRALWIHTGSSFEQKRYARLAIGEDGHLRDVRQAQSELRGRMTRARICGRGTAQESRRAAPSGTRGTIRRQGGRKAVTEDRATRPPRAPDWLWQPRKVRATRSPHRRTKTSKKRKPPSKCAPTSARRPCGSPTSSPMRTVMLRSRSSTPTR